MNMIAAGAARRDGMVLLVIAMIAITVGFSAGLLVFTQPKHFRVITDPETGCQYLVTPQGITPRINVDGTPACPSVR